MRVIKVDDVEQVFINFKMSNEMQNASSTVQALISTIVEGELLYFMPLLKEKSFEIEDINNDV